MGGSYLPARSFGHKVTGIYGLFPFYRSDVLTWLPASVLFVCIIYAGSRALSRLVSVRGFGGDSPFPFFPFAFNLLRLGSIGDKATALMMVQLD